MKSALTTTVAAIVLGFVAFWLQFDFVRDHGAYSTYLQINALNLEATDFGFARDPIFWVVLCSTTVLVFGPSGAIGFAVGRSFGGVVAGTSGVISAGPERHFSCSFQPVSCPASY
jgi:hypothetical protein